MSVFDDSLYGAASLHENGRADAARSDLESDGDDFTAAEPPQMIIVEDAPLIALDLAETMKDLGFEVRATVFTHQQALAEIERSMPEYAIIDLHLGVSEESFGNGEALLSTLDENGCRCLVFSGDENACRRVAERYPHFSVLGKPAQPRRLASEVQKLRLGRPRR